MNDALRNRVCLVMVQDDRALVLDVEEKLAVKYEATPRRR